MVRLGDVARRGPSAAGRRRKLDDLSVARQLHLHRLRAALELVAARPLVQLGAAAICARVRQPALPQRVVEHGADVRRPQVVGHALRPASGRALLEGRVGRRQHALVHATRPRARRGRIDPVRVGAQALARRRGAGQRRGHHVARRVVHARDGVHELVAAQRGPRQQLRRRRARARRVVEPRVQPPQGGLQLCAAERLTREDAGGEHAAQHCRRSRVARERRGDGGHEPGAGRGGGRGVGGGGGDGGGRVGGGRGGGGGGGGGSAAGA